MTTSDIIPNLQRVIDLTLRYVVAGGTAFLAFNLVQEKPFSVVLTGQDVSPWLILLHVFTIGPAIYAVHKAVLHPVLLVPVCLACEACTLRIHDDPDWVAHQVDRLTSQMESSMELPWAASDMPPEFQERMINSIVGVELLIDTLIGKWKVGQNHPPANRAGAIEGLIATGRPSAIELAEMMRVYSADRG